MPWKPLEEKSNQELHTCILQKLGIIVSNMQCTIRDQGDHILSKYSTETDNCISVKEEMFIFNTPVNCKNNTKNLNILY